MSRLVCRAVSVRVDGRTLLDSIDLVVDAGRCCAVMGPSGAGKSMLLRSIAGVVDHDGTIELGGRDLTGVAPHRRGVGLLFQDARLFPHLSVLDNVAYPLKLRGMSKSTRRGALAARSLADVELPGRGVAEPHQLSGGERQRVALARALLATPDLLLLDEPLTGLDIFQRRSLAALIDRVRRERDLTTVFVTHEPNDAARLADSVVVLVDGAVVGDHAADRPSGSAAGAADGERVAHPMVDALLSEIRATRRPGPIHPAHAAAPAPEAKP